MSRFLEDKLNEITKFALSNENVVSYNVAMDILKDKEDIAETELLNAVSELGKRGITIVPEEDEGYLDTEVNPGDFIPADVNIGQRSVNIYNLMERLENNEINLNPGFQRKEGLWSQGQQSRLIESLILKIPIPAFYFNASDDNYWIVIDGLQRLTAFLAFLVGIPDKNGNGRVKSRFEGLQYLEEFNGCTFDELPRQYVRRIKETSVIAYTVEKGTPDKIVFNIFQRINTGGIQLNDQEIRHALYQGRVTELIGELAKSQEFLDATQNIIKTDRMQDREYITRFIAFTELDYTKEYKGNIDSYLIKAMKLVNTYDNEEIERIKKGFKRTMDYCARIFGRYAFRKYNENWRRGPVNKALFEIWAVCFSGLSQEQLDKITENREEFLVWFGILQKDRDFITALKAGDQYSVIRRINMVQMLVKEFL